MFKQFWVTENSKSILEKIDKINCKANAKAISTFHFSTLYTKLPHFDLIALLNDTIQCTFDRNNEKYIAGFELSFQK